MTTSTATHVSAVVKRLQRVTLEEAVATADLQTRVDRKYIIDPAVLHSLVLALGPQAHVLDIDDEQCFAYRSVYFDTADLIAYRLAAHRRPHRFKIRTRSYLDTDRCVVEVKSRDRRGATVKQRAPYDLAHADELTATARAFVDEHVPEPHGLGPLHRTLTTDYRRVTLLDPNHRARLTIDSDLRCIAPNSTEVRLDDRVIVETKSTGGPTPADRLLWRFGARPLPMSKYGVGMAALDPTLASNRWHRVLRTSFGAQHPTNR